MNRVESDGTSEVTSRGADGFLTRSSRLRGSAVRGGALDEEVAALNPVELVDDEVGVAGAARANERTSQLCSVYTRDDKRALTRTRWAS